MQMSSLVQSQAHPTSGASSQANRICAWTLLTIGAVPLSFMFTCAIPFAALATFAALRLKQRDAWLAIGAVWLINQAVGFGCLNYPHSAECFIWGAGMGIAAYAVLGVVMPIKRQRWSTNGLLTMSVALAAAFVTFKAFILSIGYVLNGRFEFSATNVERMALINIGAFIVLSAGQYLAIKIVPSVQSSFATHDSARMAPARAGD